MKARKLITYLLVAGTFITNIQASYASVLHTISETHTVANGVTLLKEEVLTSNGWQDIQVLKVDLSNPYIELGVMESSTLGEKKTVLDLANENNAIAGINADFFDMSASYAPSFGPVIQDGSLSHAYHSSFTDLGANRYMATLLIDEYDNVLMDYYSIELELELEGRLLFSISHYNKLPGNIYRPLAMDYSYYQDNTSALERYSGTGIYTVLIEDNEVIYKSKQDEVVSIKEGQIAIVMNVTDAVNYYQHIQVGDHVEVVNKIVLNDQVVDAVEAMQLGVGGGGMIMKNGQAYLGESHQVTPTTRAPRTVVATTNVPDEVLLFTIDGRVNTLGATHAELVDILKRYNVKDAMYLDGGGSTTLVSREVGTDTVAIQNNPSDGSARRVTNGLGVFSTAPQGSVDTLYIESDFTHTFEGEAITFEVKGTDEYGNPVQIDQNRLNMSVVGVEGTWDGMSFYPTTSGHGVVVAEIDGAQIARDIIVTSQPAGIRIETSQINIDENSSQSITVVGIDQYGYEVAISQADISWETDLSGVSVNNGTLSATQKAMGTITATYKGVSDTAEVVVGQRVVPLYSFEDSNGRWAASSSHIEGKVEPSKEIKYHGNQSLKMTYTFEEASSSQVGYTILDQPVIIPEDARSINMWIYAQGQEDELKLQLVDANGQVHYLNMASDLAYTGWKYQTVQIPEEVAMPAQLNRIYVHAPTNDTQRTNAIYMDHLSITRGLRNQEDFANRNDYRFDPLYRESLSTPTEQDDVINISAGLNKNEFTYQQALSIYSALERYNNKVLFTSANEFEYAFGNSTSYSNSYLEETYEGVKLLFLGTDQGGIRQTNSNQWLRVKESMENSDNHLIIMTGSNPLTQFSDSREGQAFHEYLVEYKERTGKDVFVVYGNDKKETILKEGIRYIGLDETGEVEEKEYLYFKIYQGNLYYTFESML